MIPFLRSRARTLGGDFWIIVTLEKVIPWDFKPIDEFKSDQKLVPFEIEPAK